MKHCITVNYKSNTIAVVDLMRKMASDGLALAILFLKIEKSLCQRDLVYVGIFSQADKALPLVSVTL